MVVEVVEAAAAGATPPVQRCGHAASRRRWAAWPGRRPRVPPCGAGGWHRRGAGAYSACCHGAADHGGTGAAVDAGGLHGMRCAACLQPAPCGLCSDATHSASVHPSTKRAGNGRGRPGLAEFPAGQLGWSAHGARRCPTARDAQVLCSTRVTALTQ